MYPHNFRSLKLGSLHKKYNPKKDQHIWSIQVTYIIKMT